VTLSVGVLQNAHVRLEPLEAQHVDALVSAATPKEGRSTFDLAPVPRDREEMVAYVARAMTNPREVPFVIVHAGRVVGSVRLMNLEWWGWPPGPILVDGEPRVEGRDPPDICEIGHAWLAPSVQRTAVNRSSWFLLMQHAFDVWKVHRVYLKTDARNLRSRNAIEGLGARFEGILRAHLPAADGIVRDTAMFSVVRAEWPPLQEWLRKCLESAQASPHNR
jgi:N-acetyltransferase